MKMILLQDVKNVGKKGQVINASDGYAKNFLLPKKLAVEATKANLNDLALKEKSDARRRQEELEEAQALAKQLESVTVKIPVRLGEGGKLFGSVTNKEIAAGLEAQTGLAVDKKKIVVDGPFKAIGPAEVALKLHPQVAAKLKIEIVEG